MLDVRLWPEGFTGAAIGAERDDLLQFAGLLCAAAGWAWNGRPSRAGAKVAVQDATRTTRRGPGGSGSGITIGPDAGAA